VQQKCYILWTSLSVVFLSFLTLKYCNLFIVEPHIKFITHTQDLQSVLQMCFGHITIIMWKLHAKKHENLLELQVE
jgi:hypothetical protein